MPVIFENNNFYSNYLNNYNSFELMEINNFYLVKSVNLIETMNNAQLDVFFPILKLLVDVIAKINPLNLKQFITFPSIQNSIINVFNIVLTQIANNPSAIINKLNSLNNFSFGTLVNIPPITITQTFFVKYNIIINFNEFLLHNILPVDNIKINRCIQILLPLTYLQLFVLYPILLGVVNTIKQINPLVINKIIYSNYQNIVATIGPILTAFSSTLSLASFINLLKALFPPN